MLTKPGLDIEGSSYSLVPNGDYHFKVMGAKDTVSKTSGNNQIELVLSIYDANRNAESLIYDYLVEKDSMEWKTRHFCKSAEIEAVYETGNLTSLDCLHCTGMCHVVTEKATSKFPAKNKIKDYLFDESPVDQTAASTQEEDSEIPF